ncbi:MAG: hypothetical protein JW720_01785 [Sedimentisphaerales bacterium]|nr:hypothetical protein [Sedimentisphaerales bacterium]
MIELTNGVTKETGEVVSYARNSLPGFQYQNGFLFSATDLGNNGVKIEFSHENDVAAAIILPPDAVAQCGRWLLKTLGQDRHGLPNDLSDILQRLSSHKGIDRSLERGDKTRIKEALKVLKS